MYCEEHKKIENAKYEKYRRDPESKRRYGRVWKRIRDSYAKAHPYCEMCYAEGVMTPMEEVHHKLPLRDGGTHDSSNLISLCKFHHASIHARSGSRWNNKKE